LTTEGQRGGVNVIFEVREWPIIRDLLFTGLKAVQESDVLKGISRAACRYFEGKYLRPSKSTLRRESSSRDACFEGLSKCKGRGHEEEISATSIAVTFAIEQGLKSRIIDIDFTGNEHFKDSELKAP
jgi:outer membrane protein assembly factor BamA